MHRALGDVGQSADGDSMHRALGDIGQSADRYASHRAPGHVGQPAGGKAVYRRLCLDSEQTDGEPVQRPGTRPVQADCETGDYGIFAASRLP